MPIAKVIMPGARFGRWSVLDTAEIRNYPSRANVSFHLCRCDCGTSQFVADSKLRTGYSKSCGCLRSDMTVERSFVHGYAPRNARPRVYNIWNAMLSRCQNPKATAYGDYGGRGITVCDRWLKFENFLEDMGDPPEGLSIDRLDNNEGYSKENCAWRTPLDQARNRRPGKRKE